MSARSDKERRKQRKQKKNREERRRRATLHEQYQQQRQSKPPAPDLHRPPVAAPAPPRPAHVDERTPIGDWWDQYELADGQGRLRLVREKLETSRLDDEWFEAICDAVSELQGAVSEAEYVAFLEELRTSHPDVFAESEDWHTLSMASWYLAEERWEDLDRVVFALADTMTRLGEALFALVSLIRLAGRAEAAQRLVGAAISLDDRDLMPSGAEQLLNWALFPAYQACARQGATDDAIEELYRYSIEIGCRDSEKSRKAEQAFVRHLAGKGKTWTRDELLKDERRAGRRVYLLAVDLMRWLCEARGFEPMVADELRSVLVDTINDMECKPIALFRGLTREDLEPALARNLHPLSLQTAHAPAGIVAMRHFYDFLDDRKLVEAAQRDSVRSLCDVLWNDMKRAMEKDWPHYRFLQRYLPATAES